MSKTLILMRHGEEDRKTGNLTEDGRCQARNATAYMIRQGFNPEIIMHSIFPRAKQTGEIVAEKFRKAIPQITTQLLESPDLVAEDLSKAISELEESLNTVLMVSHGPDIYDALKKLTLGHNTVNIPNGQTIVIVGQDGESWRDMASQPSNTVRFNYTPSSSPFSLRL